MNRHLMSALALVATLSAGTVKAADAVTEAWAKTVQQAAFVKDGMERLRNSQYQYECLGLGGTVMRVGPHGMTRPGAPDANNAGHLTHLPYLSYRIIADDDPLVRASCALFRTSKTGDYVFNNGWMGVVAAKLHDGEEACRWAKQMIRPGITLFDDTCFGEIISDFEDFKKTPEVAAHGALICNITQMLLDADDEKSITVFPAIPAEWERQGVAFNDLAAKGNVLVSGEFKPTQVRVTLENRSDTSRRTDLRVRLPKGTTRLRLPDMGLRVEQGWAVLPNVNLPSKGKREYIFEPLK